MKYLQNYTAFFHHPRWGMNLLFGGICVLIPAIGPIVWLGYLVDNLLQRTPGQAPGDFPAFDFSNFTRYLMRGLWPFLVMLVLMIPCMCLIACAYLPLLLIPLLDLRGGVIALPILLTIVCYLAALIAWGCLVFPFALRAALTQDFAAAFNLAWIRGFLAKVWPQLLLGHLFLMLTALPLILVGYCALFVGVYPAMALMMFAQWQVMAQLYDRYLELGGAPVLPKR